MGRPAKSVNVLSKRLTADEKRIRTETEESLKGKSDNIRPPNYLSGTQKEIFNYIVMCLEESNILCNLDVYILAQASICVDRMAVMEQEINDNPELLTKSSYMSSKDKYTKDFFRCCNELCLSPQSRAKIANLNTQGKQENPLDKILGGLNDE